ncbi:phage tail length tape measure family protein [Aureimonas glaciei]|uniref:Bacteriophage tail tape measure N-terminal domain-containing protein n=1 Tax=Aureimonas glaciei TaxID=1776957 RepID=A0A917DC84_9HYPH|nr:phage tail length tape measure family protein [Aureimonas glaciei]GGD24392.1 hypothetical protein GCM10011335_29110 [Aureimonas glaciei]
MADIASLGLSITSAPAKVAAADRNVLTTAAVATEAAVEKLGTTSSKAARASKEISAAAREAGQGAKTAAAGVTALAQANDNATRSIDKTRAALAALTAAEAGNNSSSRSMRADDVAAYGNALDDLRAKYSPLFAVQRTYLASLDDIRQARKVGALSMAEEAAAVQRLDRAYLAQTAALTGTRAQTQGVATGVAAVGSAAKLTSNQLLNLSRQGNDTITMLAMGAPVSQVFASQIGQIYGALEEGPGGLRGSLKAAGDGIMGFARGAASALGPGGMVIAGVSAATAAAIYFTDKTESNLLKIDKAAKSYAETLKVIERSQRGLGAGISSVVDEAQRRNPAEIAVTNAREIQAQREALRAARQNALNIDPVDVDMLPNVITDFRNLFREIGGAVAASDLDMLGRDFYEASRPIADIRTDIEQILASEGLPGYLRDAAENMLSLVNSGDAALAKIRGLEEGAARLRRMTALSDIEAGGVDFQRFVPGVRTERDEINRAYQARIAPISRLGGADRGMAESLLKAADNDRLKALDEIGRKEGVIRQKRELDLRAVGARTVAEQALVAEQQKRLELSGSLLTDAEKELAVAHERAMLIAQTNKAAEDTLRSSRQQNASAGLQGYQAAAQAIIDRYALEIDKAKGAESAVRDLTAARNLDLQTLQLQTRRSLFQPQQDQLASLAAEAAAIGASDDVRRRLIDGLKVENDIRQAGVSSTGAQADAYRANAAALSEYEDRVRKSAGAWDDVKQAGESAIDGLVGSITSGDLSGALKSIADDVAKTALQLAVANPLKNALLGTSYGTMGDLLNGPGAAPTLGVPGVQSTAAMNVTAAVVNIGGVGMGGAGGAIERLLNPANGNAPGGVASATLGKNGLVPVSEVAAYIQQAAAARGIDPNIALRVAKSEGLGEGIWQSNYEKNGYREPSYGPFQLLKGGAGTGFGQGMGNDFMRQTGLDPADPRNTFQGIDFALDGAAKNGWGAWYGAGKAGIGNREGLAGAQPIGVNLEAAVAKLDAAAPKLAASAETFATDFSQSASTVTSGLGQIAETVVPGLGGVLQTLISTISNASGGGGGIGSLIGGLGSILGFASGTDSAPGGLAMVGERGPELMNVPKGAQIIPNHVLSSMAQARGQQQQQASQHKEVTLGVRIDEETGTIMPYVKKIADDAVESKRGSFVGQSTAAATRTVRNNFGGMLNEYQTRRA